MVTNGKCLTQSDCLTHSNTPNLEMLLHLKKENQNKIHLLVNILGSLKWSYGSSVLRENQLRTPKEIYYFLTITSQGKNKIFNLTIKNGYFI